MLKTGSLLLGLCLSVSLCFAQKAGKDWEKKLENEMCDCLGNKTGEDAPTTQQALKEVLLNCFMSLGAKYEQQLMKTAEKEGLTPNEVGGRIGQSLAANCESMKTLGARIEQSGENDRLQLEKVNELMEQGEYAQAESTLSNLLKVYADDASLYNLRGLSRENLGNFWGAVADYHRAFDLDAANGLYTYNLGNILANADFFTDALPFLQHSLARNDQDEDTWLLLGAVHYNLEDFDSTRFYMEGLLRLNPKHAKAYNFLGLAAEKKEQWAEAINHYERAIQQDRDYAVPYLNLADLYVTREESEQAKKVLLSFDKRAYDPQITRELAALARKEERYQEALDYYLKIQKNQDAGGADYYYMGETYRKMGNKVMAVTLFDQALQQLPDDSDVHYSLASALLDVENYGRAGVVLEQLLALEPGDAYNYDLRAQYYEKTGKPEAALADLQESARIYPNDPEVYLNQGRLLLSLNKAEEACAAFHTAAEYDEDRAREAIETHCAPRGTH